MHFGLPLTSRNLSAAGKALAAALLLSAALIAAVPPHAFALSEIKREELPPLLKPGEAPANDDTVPPAEAAPPPAETPAATPTVPAAPTQPGAVERHAPADNPTASPDESAEPVPQIVYDLGLLPEPVRRMHGLILEACRSGDLERLRPLLGLGDNPTMLSFGDTPEDPIAFLKSISGDPDGQEILAIMEEVLSAGYVHLYTGTAEELYIWPYFFAVPLDGLTAPQRVELFKIVTYGDYEGMKEFGGYAFYRLGIAPDGRWAFFVAGD